MSYLIENILQRMITISSKDFTTDRKIYNIEPSKHEKSGIIREQQKAGFC